MNLPLRATRNRDCRHVVEQKNHHLIFQFCRDFHCRGSPVYTAPLVWNGRPFNPFLDHKNGNNSDNRPENLRYLCPNCDSQLSGWMPPQLAEATRLFLACAHHDHVWTVFDYGEDAAVESTGTPAKR